jgi:hypothetical protein
MTPEQREPSCVRFALLTITRNTNVKTFLIILALACLFGWVVAQLLKSVALATASL